MKLLSGLLVVGIFVSQAATVQDRAAARRPSTDQQTIVTQAQANRWLRLWQGRLALDEWKIEVRIVRAQDLNPDTLGNLKWNATNRTAVVKVLNPLDYDLPAAEIPADIERTVVHELVHLELSVLPRNGSKIVEEQVVNKMTEALLGLDRGENYAARLAFGSVQPKVKRQGASSGDTAARSK
jgi:hypothetical protein